MIKNTQQENLTREKIAELLELKNSILMDIELSEIEKEYSLNSFDAMISSLQEEVEEYENLKNGNFNILEANSLDEIPKLLIKARIIRHMSQTELAKKLGIQAQQIQRYEANEYQSISYDRLSEIAKILNVCTGLDRTICIGNGPTFETPENVSEEEIIKAEQKTKEKCSLFM